MADEFAVQGVDFTVPGTLSNGVTIDGNGDWVVPAGITSWTFSLQTLTDANGTESNEKVNLTVGGVTGFGVINNLIALQPLTDVAVFETPYEMLTGPQRTASATGGAYPSVIAGRNPANTTSHTYNLWHCATIGGTYTLVASDISYAAVASLEGDISYDHRELTVAPKSDYPTTISTPTPALIENIATGAKEFILLRDLSTTVISGDTSLSHKNTGVGIYYTPPIRVEYNEDGKLFLLTNKAIDATLRTTECFYKFQPKTTSGDTLALSSITPVRLAITNRAASPNYPRDIALTFDPGGVYGSYSYFPESIGGSQTYIRLKPSSRTAEVTPSSFFEPSGLTEAGNQLKVDVRRDRGASIVRTLTASGSNNYVHYSESDRGADLLHKTTHYSAYVQNGVYKSLPFESVIEQAPANINNVQNVSAAIVGANLEVTLNMDAANGSDIGDGTERIFVWVDIAGTTLSKLNLAAKTYNSTDVTTLEDYSEGSEFYLQVLDPDIHPIVITIPYTAAGATGSIKIKAGAPNSSREVSITI